MLALSEVSTAKCVILRFATSKPLNEMLAYRNISQAPFLQMRHTLIDLVWIPATTAKVSLHDAFAWCRWQPKGVFRCVPHEWCSEIPTSGSKASERCQLWSALLWRPDI